MTEFDSDAPPSSVMVPPPPSGETIRSPFSEEIHDAVTSVTVLLKDQERQMRHEMHKLASLILRRDHFTQQRLDRIEANLGLPKLPEPPEPAE